MLVKDLIKLLKTLDKDAVIDMASDEEGNTIGDIEGTVAEGILQGNGKKVYTLYPINQEDPTERYREIEEMFGALSNGERIN